MDNKSIYHYVYRITNISSCKHYYGKRSSNIIPEKDLGVKYFSSSTDKKFIHDQKTNPQKYKYKIIKLFKTATEAVEFEIKLHRKFNVGINENFYNKSNQTSSGYDTTGMVSVKDKNGNTMIVSKDDTRYLSGELVRLWLGKTHSDMSKSKIGKSNSISQLGCRNSNYGNVWISYPEFNLCKRVKKELINLYYEQGWVISRKGFGNQYSNF